MASDRELEQQLAQAGNMLLEPPASIDALLPLLDQVETCLSRVEQSPTKTMQTALSSAQRALVMDKLFRHSNVDVKVAVASCISEITRITAPDAPYDDDQMKEVFQLIVSSFENLSDKSSQSYTKRTSILETVAKVRSCVVMLDLECDALIVEMFRHFLRTIRDDHPENVFTSMEIIMNLVLEESEDIPVELLSPILACVKKDNENILPIARKLGEKVLESCAAKVKPYLLQAVKSSGMSLDDYSEVVTSICQEASGDDEQNDVHVANEHTTNENESKLANQPLDEAPQVDKEMATEAEAEAEATEQVDPVNEGSPKSVVNNGVHQTGEDDPLADSSSLKKQEHTNITDQFKSVDALSNAGSDSPAADKVGSAEGKTEHTTRKRGKKLISSIKLAEPSESCQIEGEKENESSLDHKNNSKPPSSSHEEPAAEGAVCSENEKETGIQISFPKATEGESTDVVPPSPVESFPHETRAQRSIRSKKKESLLKQASPSTDDVSKKATEGTSDSDSKPHKRLGKKVLSESANEDKATVDTSKKERAGSSDPEANPLKQLSKKVESSSNNGDGSSLKQSNYKKRREKAISGKDTTRSSTKDKDTGSSPKSAAKPMKDEPHMEETAKTNSKRKRTPGKEKASYTGDLGENLVGSKVKVWWPKDCMFYEGVVDSFDAVKKKHKVCYVDGDEEILYLKRERWEFVGGDSDTDEEEATGHHSPDGSSEMPLKKKVNASSERSSKQKKLDTSPKKNVGASSSKFKVTDSKSGCKSKDEIKVDGKSRDGSKTITKSENDNVSKTKDHTLKSSSKSVDVFSKSGGKAGHDAIKTPKTSSKSKPSKLKQETPKISSNARGKSPNTVRKSNANGTGKSKASTTSVKEDEDVKDSTDSTKPAESAKGKTSSPVKTPGSEAKSGKKRRRGSKS